MSENGAISSRQMRGNVNVQGKNSKVRGRLLLFSAVLDVMSTILNKETAGQKQLLRGMNSILSLFKTHLYILVKTTTTIKH